MKVQKALITGVGGFVGPYLVRHLVDNGFEVFGVDRSGKKVDGCKVYPCDVTDAALVAEVVKKVSPSHVFHLAGQSSVARSWTEPELTWKVNVDGMRNLFDAVAAAGISPKMLLVSSAEVYGVPKIFPTPETHPIAPVSPYGRSKVEQERIALEFLRKERLHVVIARSFNHTGPGQSAEFVCSNFAKQLADIGKGLQPPVVKIDNPEIKRDFTDVRDVVNAYSLLLMKGVAGEAYNVCSGRAYAIGKVLDRLVGISGLNVKVMRERSRLRARVVPVLQGDNSRLKAATGWRPLVPLEVTLADLLRFWREKV